MAKPSLYSSLLAGILLCVANQVVANPCLDKSWLATTILALGEKDGHGLGGTGNRPSEDGHGIGGTGRSDQRQTRPVTRGLAAQRTDPGDGSGIGGTGIVGIIAGFGSICVNGQEIHYDAKTPVSRDGLPAAETELAIGQRVAVQASALGNGEFRASQIRVLHEVVGPAHIDEDGLSVLGQRIRLSGATSISGMQENQTLAISGHRLPEGEILATRIEARPDAHPSLNGNITAISDGSFNIGALTVKSEGARNFNIGQALHIQGRLIDGILQAELLQPAPLENWLPGQRTLLIQGYVRPGNAGQINVDGLGVHLPPDWSGELAPGSRISISARIDGDGRAFGERIRIEQDRPGTTGESRVGRQIPLTRPRNEVPEKPGNSEGRPSAGEAASRPQLERETPSRTDLIRPEFLRSDFEHPASPRADLPMRGETRIVERLRVERARPELPPRPR